MSVRPDSRSDAVESWLRTQAGPMLGVARRYLPQEDEARQAVQEALMRALETAPGDESSAADATWLHELTLEAALRRLRSRPPPPETDIGAWLPRFRADGTHAEGPAARRERMRPTPPRNGRKRLLHRCIDRLPEAHRTVLLLCDAERLSTRAVARRLELSEASVRTRLHQARLALCTLLDDPEQRDADGAPPAEIPVRWWNRSPCPNTHPRSQPCVSSLRGSTGSSTTRSPQP